MSLEEVKCLGSPRTSQMPKSGSGQFAAAISTCVISIGQKRSGRWSRERVWR
jgi:hypothetical protein